VSEPGRAPLSADTIHRLAGPVWSRVDVVETTGSTNADLLARAASGENISGAVLLAEQQSSGRGRQGRSWATPPRSQIAMSVGVDPNGVEPDAWGWLPLLTGVAVTEAVREQCGVEAKLKWPNDIQVNREGSTDQQPGKLAGILAEVAAPKPVIVVGLGLNVSLTAAEAPVDTATSLTMLGVPAVDRDALAANILHHLASRVGQWRTAGRADPDLLAAYRSLSNTLGSQVRAELPGGRELLGTAVDIDPMGRLIIDDGSARTAIAAGDVTHLRGTR
jgi:BirA family biotin operon repressor/biotin-[acetyl-CoA-carboxylase] ligase